MRKYIPLILIGAFVAGVLFIYPYYESTFAPNVSVPEGQTGEFFIPTGASYDQIANLLVEQNIIKDPKGFDWVAQRMNYPNHVYPGRYVIQDGWNNRELLTLLRSGKQSPIKYTFVKFRTVEDFAEDVSNKFEMSKSQLLGYLNDPSFLDDFGLNRQTAMGIFIPNTYEMYWNTSPEDFVKRMYKEYKAFWNESRNAKAKKLRLTRLEVMTLASIVEEETNQNDEKPRVAGVYLNRIRKRMPLQADPTVKFAVGDFSLKRILNKHLEVDSPYNTYKYPGIPPGPICTPSIPSIDGVLNEEKHKYLYFCARTDNSGYHQFSKTLAEHNQYAREYHKWLNEIGIR